MKFPIPNFKKLSKEDMAEVREFRRNLTEKYRSTPKTGLEIEYLGDTLIVYPNVFHPQQDSQALTINFTINKGDVVLDIGTGSGAIAINAAKRSALKVLAVDINPNAVKSATENVNRLGFEGVTEVRLSNGFKLVKDSEIFDVITANLPFTNEPSRDFADVTVYDEGLKAHKNFFENADKHLRPGGRIYLAQANYGPLEEVFELINKAGFKSKLIGQNKSTYNPKVYFYAFEITRK